MAEGCERGTRKGERDAACVGMDQCVNGCCLTRTAEIIVSDLKRILRKYTTIENIVAIPGRDCHSQTAPEG